jgi:hypothetical protein
MSCFFCVTVFTLNHDQRLKNKSGETHQIFKGLSTAAPLIASFCLLIKSLIIHSGVEKLVAWEPHKL